MGLTPVKQAKFQKQAKQRVVRVRKARKSKPGEFMNPARDDERRGLAIMKDNHGQLFLTRTSPDGWTEAYALSDLDGPLMTGRRK